MGNKLDICCSDDPQSMMVVSDVQLFMAPSTQSSSLRRSGKINQKQIQSQILNQQAKQEQERIEKTFNETHIAQIHQMKIQMEQEKLKSNHRRLSIVQSTQFSETPISQITESKRFTFIESLPYLQSVTSSMRKKSEFSQNSQDGSRSYHKMFSSKIKTDNNLYSTSQQPLTPLVRQKNHLTLLDISNERSIISPQLSPNITLRQILRNSRGLTLVKSQQSFKNISNINVDSSRDGVGINNQDNNDINNQQQPKKVGQYSQYFVSSAIQSQQSEEEKESVKLQQESLKRDRCISEDDEMVRIDLRKKSKEIEVQYLDALLSECSSTSSFSEIDSQNNCSENSEESFSESDDSVVGFAQKNNKKYYNKNSKGLLKRINDAVRKNSNYQCYEEEELLLEDDSPNEKHQYQQTVIYTNEEADFDKYSTKHSQSSSVNIGSGVDCNQIFIENKEYQISINKSQSLEIKEINLIPEFNQQTQRKYKNRTSKKLALYKLSCKQNIIYEEPEEDYTPAYVNQRGNKHFLSELGQDLDFQSLLGYSGDLQLKGSYHYKYSADTIFQENNDIDQIRQNYQQNYSNLPVDNLLEVECDENQWVDQTVFINPKPQIKKRIQTSKLFLSPIKQHFNKSQNMNVRKRARRIVSQSPNKLQLQH